MNENTTVYILILFFPKPGIVFQTCHIIQSCKEKIQRQTLLFILVSIQFGNTLKDKQKHKCTQTIWL